jgi:hypothetical protein
MLKDTVGETMSCKQLAQFHVGNGNTSAEKTLLEWLGKKKI